MYKDKPELIRLAQGLKLKEGDIIPFEKSPCCDKPIKYTETSGVYIEPGAYCSGCDKLIGYFK